jgi:hypothetical protein
MSPCPLLPQPKSLGCAFFAAFYIRVLAIESKPCYRYDGTLSDYSYNGFDKYFPCDPTLETSHCCYGLDICLDNGLCMGFNPDLRKDRILSLAGCTNPAWPLPCPQHFVSDRHNVPDGWPKIGLFSCDTYGEYCVSTKPSGDAWDASCCANESLRIKGIPWWRTMHLAMDPSQRIHVYTGNFPVTLAEEGIDDKPDTRDPFILTVVGATVAVITVLVGICQWQFPKLRLWRWIVRRRRLEAEQAGRFYRHGSIDLSRDEPVVRGSGTAVDLETSPGASAPSPNIPTREGNPFESYGESIGDLLETEDGWRER